MHISTLHAGRSIANALLLMIAAFTAEVGASEAVPVAHFDHGLEGWVFSSGTEYPGVQGRMEPDGMVTHGGAGALRLVADFAKGGMYVSATHRFASSPPQVAMVSLWVRTENLGAAVIRLIDGTGQCHQHTVPIATDKTWQEVRIEALASRTKWGGANDGRWHPPLRSIGILVEKRQRRDQDATVAALSVDDVVYGTTVAERSVFRIPSGDFETTRDSWWGHHDTAISEAVRADDGVARSGRRSLRIDGDFSRGGWVTAIKQFDQPVDLRELSLWVRSDNLRSLNLRILSDSGQEIQRTIQLDPAAADWQHITLTDLPPGADPAKGRKLQLYGARTLVSVGFGKASLIDPGRTTASLWLDDVDVVATGDGPVRVPGHSLAGAGPLTARIDLPHALPFFWGPDNPPKAITVVWENRGEAEAKTALVELLDHRQARVAILSPGGELLGKQAVLRQELPLTLPAFGQYTIRTKVLDKPLSARLAWIAAVAKPDPAGKIGVQTHFNQGPWGKSQHLDGARSAVDLLVRMGAGWVRDDARYEDDGRGGMLPEPDQGSEFYAWRHLTNAGVGCMMTYTDYSCGKDQQPPHTSEGRAVFAARFASLVRRYRDRIRVFEVWNEPNIQPGWRGRRPDAGEYAAMLQEAYRAAKAVDPQVTVIGVTSCGTDFAFIEKVLGAVGGQAMDAISCHPYHGVAPESRRASDGPNPVWMGEGDRLTFADRMAVISELQTRNGGTAKPIWCDEFGYGAKSDALEYRHGLWIIRQYLIAMSLPTVERMINYTLMDQGYDEDPSSHMTFGLIRSDGSPEPRYVMLNTLARVLRGRRWDRAVDIGEGMQASAFVGGDEPLHVLWGHDSGRTVALKTSKALHVTDLMGNTRSLAPIDGRVCLGVTGEPLFVTGVATLVTVPPALELRVPARATSEDAIVFRLRASGAWKPRWVGRSPPGWTAETIADGIRFHPNPQSASGTYELVAEDIATGFSAAVDVTLANEIELTARPGESATVHVEASNPFAHERVLQLGLRSALQDIPAQELRLPPGGKASCDVPVTAQQKDGWTTVPVALNPELHGNGPGIIRFAPPGSDRVVAGVTPCLRLGQQAVDGSAREWSGSSPCLLRLPHQARMLTASAVWGGPEDCSAQLWTGWDDAAFALVVQVHDDVRTGGFAADEMWKGDSVQFAVAIDGRRYEYTVARDQRGVVIFRSAPLPGPAVGVTAAVVEDGSSTTYEIRLPWSALDADSTCLSRLRFAMLVNDNDVVDPARRSTGRKGFIEWFGGIGDGKDPQRFGGLLILPGR